MSMFRCCGRVLAVSGVGVLTLAACAGLWRMGGASSPAQSPTAVVPASALAGDSYTRAGPPDSSIQTMLGPELSFRARTLATAVPEATCRIQAAQSALSWLCQGEPIPGLGQSIDEHRSDNTITPTHTPTILTTTPESQED